MKRDITKRKTLLEDVKYMCQLLHSKEYQNQQYSYKQIVEMFDVIVLGLSEDDFEQRYKTTENL